MLNNYKYLTITNIKVSGKRLNNSFNILTSKKFYNGLFQRPTQSLFSHFQILSVIEILNFLNKEMMFSWSMSIAISTSFVRVLQIPFYFLVKDIRFSKIIPFKNFFNKWSHKLIFNDFYIDMKRNKIKEQEKQRMIEYYDLNLIVSYVPQVVFMLNYFRALNSMSIHPHFYENFTNDLNLINLASHDIYFILPVLVIINNFLLIRKIDHPWLINYRDNKMKILYISFILGIFSIFVPKCYCISYLSYCLTHMIIKTIQDYMTKRKESSMTYETHVKRHYKFKVQEILKIK